MAYPDGVKTSAAPAMSLDDAFRLANLLALAGWLALLGSPFAPRLAQRVAGLGVTLALAALYAGLLLAFWGAGDGAGDFATLDGVAALFARREVLLAGWVHYLAFDLFVGAWEVRVARRDGLPFLAVVPCLAATFLFGPAGLLLFFALRLALRPGAGTPFPGGEAR